MESLCEREIFQNHIKIKQNRGAGKIILVSTPKGILFLQRPNGRKLLNFILLFLAMAMLKQA